MSFLALKKCEFQVADDCKKLILSKLNFSFRFCLN